MESGGFWFNQNTNQTKARGGSHWENGHVKLAHTEEKGKDDVDGSAPVKTGTKRPGVVGNQKNMIRTTWDQHDRGDKCEHSAPICKVSAERGRGEVGRDTNQFGN